MKASPVGKAEGGDEPLAIPILGGQGLGLLIADLLQDVFHPAQEAIGGEQAFALAPRQGPAGRWRPAPRAGGGTRRAGSRPPRMSCSAWAMNSTSRMPPAPSLMLPSSPFAAHLGGDHRLHLAQAVDDAEVDVAAEHEGRSSSVRAVACSHWGPAPAP